MKRRIVLLWSIFLVPFLSFAQFSDHTDPIFYAYDYTDTDGIKSLEEDQMSSHFGSAFVFIFKNGIAVYEETSIKVVSENRVDTNELAKRMSNALQYMSKTQPSSAYETERIYKYCEELSSYAKKTYRASKHIVNSWVDPGNFMLGIMPSSHMKYNGWTWENRCFTFNNDKSQMIEWSYSKPLKRRYFKRVSSEELKESVRQKLDFLYE